MGSLCLLGISSSERGEGRARVGIIVRGEMVAIVRRDEGNDNNGKEEEEGGGHWESHNDEDIRWFLSFHVVGFCWVRKDP